MLHRDPALCDSIHNGRNIDSRTGLTLPLLGWQWQYHACIHVGACVFSIHGEACLGFSCAVHLPLMGMHRNGE